jgi:phosphoribosylaminoimidazolecarboxamide formyltransferase / IMP cyclohydrolase
VLLAAEPLGGGTEFRQVSGGLVVQQRDDVVTEAATAAGITLHLTGARHFAH